MRNTSLLFLFSVYFWHCKGRRRSMEISFVLEEKQTWALLNITHCWGRGRVWTWARRGLEDWAHSPLLVFSPLASVPDSVRWSRKEEEDWVEGWCSLRWVWGRGEEGGMWSCGYPLGGMWSCGYPLGKAAHEVWVPHLFVMNTPFTFDLRNVSTAYGGMDVTEQSAAVTRQANTR